MRSLLKNLILCLLICQSFELAAQYQFLLKGSPSLYDTSVNIQITEYRRIREKVTIADSLVDALSSEINQSLDIIEKQDAANATLLDLVSRQEKTIARKDETIDDLNTKFDELAKAATKPKKWYRTNGFKYGAGFLLGALIIKL